MSTHGWHLTILASVIVALVTGSYLIGPPSRWPAAENQTLPVNPVVEPFIPKEGIMVQAFGTIPGCDAPETIGLVIGLLRRKTSEHIEGLTDVGQVATINSGGVFCSASVETGRRKASVQYEMSGVRGRSRGWTVAILP